mmetsp:Transcript_73493/g.153429  ORF Transcript_73493/g.153429 Transcript_73493/m.153429 type:complete len:187 (+) Transcript_73493:1-561(+)
MMSNMYQAIERKSERQWMIDLYQLVKESSRFALTVPAPFNLLWILNELAVFVLRLRDGTLDELYGSRMPWRMKLRHHVSRNMSTHHMLEERGCVAQEEKARQKLRSFMERARLKWREGQVHSGLMQDKIEAVETRIFDMKKQIASLHDQLAQNDTLHHGFDPGRFSRRTSNASVEIPVFDRGLPVI